MHLEKEEKKVTALLIVFVLIAVTVLGSTYYRHSAVPDIIGRELSKEEQKEIIRNNSSLTDYVRLSPHAEFPRKDEIKAITIHYMEGDFTLDHIGRTFSYSDRNVSANYGIDSNGNVGLFVEEENASRASHDEKNDSQAVTIEVANDEIGGEWHVSDQVIETLVDLCADICWRNNIEKLVYSTDASGNFICHKNLSKDTECPGPYLESKMGGIAEKVNERLGQLKGE